MYYSHITQLAYEALLLILVLSGPPVIISMVFGLIVAIFQAATQIQEQTLSFVIKLIAVVISLMLLGPWLGSAITRYAADIFNNFPRWGG